ncbi:ABC transporter substrate-binding protein [Fictibacillus aquaticus]|uniref:Sugar ABC transporter substrate-binding protein n=1 Tax=Fictibacillus aquaticus TaxID=2021314 RepID=A0A235F8Z2_9BACL|nr:sugar ABC transporter substrate-binding protein [Fictibacillus aquaticus]OYD57483.1 sugar ABC transporter substrate-binding protein [Fictibacillus aquaticus]
MKRVLSAALSSVLLAGALAGCSGNGGTPELASKKVDGKIDGEITVWGWNVAAQSMELAVKDFKKKHPDVKVKVEDIGRLDVYDKLTVGLAANGSGLADVILVEDDRLDNYKNNFPKGLADLSSLGFDKHEKKFSQSKIDVAKDKDGKFVAFPWDSGPTGVFYRVDLFEKAGVDADSIKTWDDYIEAGKKIKEKTGVQMLPVDVAKDDALFRMMLNQQDAYYFNKKGEISFASKESKRALKVIQDMKKEDLVVNADGWNGTVAATVNSKVATVPFGVWYSGTIIDQAPDLKGKWDVFQLPSFEEDGNRAANLGGSNLVIPAGSDNIDAAYAFAEFFTTDEKSQMTALKEKGIFPSLLSTYEDPYFDERNEYFNNKPVFRMFADEMQDVPSPNYTEDYARALKYAADAQGKALLSNDKVAEVLKEAAESLKNETNRDIE